MKVEIKKITVEQEVYISEDGKEFDSSDDCEAYEYRLIGKKLKMYTHLGKPTNTVEDCLYVNLDSSESISSFVNLCKFDGISYNGIDKQGVYLYTEGRYGDGHTAWTNISEIVKSVKESEDTE